jgi:hypothetical protein
MLRTKYTRSLIGFTAIGLMAGCFDFGGGEGCNTPTNGLAGNGNFTYECSSAADPQCDGRTSSTYGPPPLPAAIARGARFGLRLAGGTVQPVSPTAVASVGQDFVALRTGKVGFVVSTGGEAVDAIRLDIVEPEQIVVAKSRSQRGELEAVVPSPPLQLAPSASTAVRAVAMKPGVGVFLNTGVLAGTIPVEWTIDAPDVASFAVEPDGTCLVTGLAEGRAELTAKMGILSGGVSIVVSEAPDPRDSGISDAGIDGDADPDAGDRGDAGGDS